MTCSVKKIAILGATGQIAKNLISIFSWEGKHELFLFARSLVRLNEYLQNLHSINILTPKSFSEFYNFEYDVIINCVGIGDPAKLKTAGASIFRLTETFDNLVLDYLENHTQTLYINFSSGAVYGTDFTKPVDEATITLLDINNITPRDYYRIAKINAEAKHRALRSLNIIDLRVFGFFSRFIDLEAQYLMSEIISCVKYNKELVTDVKNITRDFVHPQDLASLIERCMENKLLNDTFDVYSLSPITKFNIIDYFSEQYGLKYTIKDDINKTTATGSKDNYFSKNRKAQQIGYVPNFTSLDSIILESKEIFRR